MGVVLQQLCDSGTSHSFSTSYTSITNNSGTFKCLTSLQRECYHAIFTNVSFSFLATKAARNTFHANKCLPGHRLSTLWSHPDNHYMEIHNSIFWKRLRSNIGATWLGVYQSQAMKQRSMVLCWTAQPVLHNLGQMPKHTDGT